MSEEKRSKKFKAAYIIIPILIIIIAFIVYTIIQYIQFSAQAPEDIEWSEKDINIG